MRHPGDVDNERGAVLVTMLVGLITLMVVAALVVDLATVRANRAASRAITDSAAAAGAIELRSRDGRAACEVAAAYLDLNVDAATPFTGIDCSPFPTSCNSTTPQTTTIGTVDTWTATIVYPVLSADPMMDPAAIGAGPQALHPGDGHPCDRIGVMLHSRHRSFFASVFGHDVQRTEVHTVALAAEPVGADVALNVLILERYDCDAVTAAGSGGGIGGIFVDGVINTDDNRVDPGYLAVDSDGSGADCGGDGTIDVDGTNSRIRADGPPGCDGELGTHMTAGYVIGEGCGAIRTYALGTPGCNYPACTSSGTVAPEPEQLPRRLTRAPVDHRYNCKASYPFPAGWEIDGCDDPPDPNIDQLVAAYGVAGTTPPGFVTWTSLGHPCLVDGPPGTRITVSGDIRVDCPLFDVKRDVIFEGGDVIFDGSVDVVSTGMLAINADSSQPFPFGPVGDEAIAYFRDGTLNKAGQAHLILHETMTYFSTTSRITMTGGTGVLVWSAPSVGDLEDLAMWSDSALPHDLAGQAQLVLEGVFFAPWARVTYQGNGVQQNVDAQFVVRKLSASGQGILVVRPRYERAVLFPTVVTQLIR